MPSHAQTARYEACCQKVKDAIAAELRAHPSDETVLVFGWPKKIAVIAVLGDAERLGLIRANEAGKRLIQAARSAVPPNEEPTVLMFRACYEVAQEEASHARSQTPVSP